MNSLVPMLRAIHSGGYEITCVSDKSPLSQVVYFSFKILSISIFLCFYFIFNEIPSYQGKIQQIRRISEA